MWKKFIIGGSIVLVGAALFPLIGFGSGGIIFGSIAAGIQSSIGNVAAGSLFATLTSYGMTGISSLLSKVGLGLISGGLISKICRRFA